MAELSRAALSEGSEKKGMSGKGTLEVPFSLPVPLLGIAVAQMASVD